LPDPERPKESGYSPEINEAIAYWEEYRLVTAGFARIRDELAELEARAKALIRPKWARPVIPALITFPEGTLAHISRNYLPVNPHPEEFEAWYLEKSELNLTELTDATNNWLVIDKPPANLGVTPILPDSKASES